MIAYIIAATNDGLSNLAMWSLIVGALTPPLVAVIQRPKWSGTARTFFMLLAATVDGVVVAWLEGNLDFARFTNSALVAGVAIITAYYGIWKPTGVAPKIEKATS
jgi:hypothetical protein